MIDLFTNEASVSKLFICKGLFQVLYLTLYPLLVFFLLKVGPPQNVWFRPQKSWSEYKNLLNPYTGVKFASL